MGGGGVDSIPPILVGKQKSTFLETILCMVKYSKLSLFTGVPISKGLVDRFNPPPPFLPHQN